MSTLTRATPLPPPAYDYKVEFQGSSIVGIEKSGRRMASGSNMTQIMTAIFSKMQSGALIWLEPSTTVYPWATQVGLSKDVTIWMYGATIQGTTSSQNGAFINQGAGTSFRTFGGTWDQNKLMGTAFGGGSGASNITPRLCVAKDCLLDNVDNYGIQVNSGNDQSGAGDMTLVLDNVEFDAGATDSDNEFVLTNALRNVFIRNCRMYGNKLAYLSARNIVVDGLYSDVGALTESAGIGIHSITGSLNNLNLNGHDVTLRPYGTVHFGTLYSSARRLSLTNSTIDFVSTPVTVTGYDNTYIIDQCILENLWLNDGNVLLADFEDQTHSKVKQLIMKNIHISDFNSNNTALLVRNHDIEFLDMDGIYTPSYPTVNTPVRFDAEDSNLVISYCKMNNLYPMPGTNMITVEDDGASARSITITLEAPLRNGINATRTNGTATSTKTWFRNYGTGTIANAATNSGNIAHGLAYTPSAADFKINFTENPTNTPGSWWLSGIDATNFVLNVENDPGASGLDFSWSVGVC